MKLWSGRFEKDTDALVDALNASIDYDQRMYRQDITGSIAHATMLGKTGIIPQSEAELICKGLAEILEDVEAGKIEFTRDNEDIHMNVEALLTARIGDAGKRLHTARSRNDQVALDIRMYLRDQIAEIMELTLKLIAAICDRAEENLESIMPGYTHLQRAQPSTFAHYTMAYAEMLRRDVGRLADCAARMNYSPLGSGAMGGTTYPIDRALTARLLDFDGYTANSIDGVSDRDFVIELSAALSMLMMHLSRFSEEIVLWSSTEFSYITLDDAYATGSSIMPQKKNPDIAELVRGKTGRVYGSLTTLLTMMKGLPLAYNKDMQEDKEAIFDSFDTVRACLGVFSPMLETMNIRPENMRAAAAGGFINATDLADYLVGKGLPFRTAYKIVGQLVAECGQKGCVLETLPLEAYRAHSELFDEDLYTAIALDTCVARRTAGGGPAPESVTAQIAALRAQLNA